MTTFTCPTCGAHATATPPTFGGTDQQAAALAKANDHRTAGRLLKEEVAAGTISIAQALTDPRSDSVRIGQLLRAQRGWGQTRVERALEKIGCVSFRPCGKLTARQRRVIPEVVLGRELTPLDDPAWWSFLAKTSNAR